MLGLDNVLLHSHMMSMKNPDRSGNELFKGA